MGLGERDSSRLGLYIFDLFCTIFSALERKNAHIVLQSIVMKQVDDAFALEIAPRPRPSISATAHSSAPASTLTATARRASLSQNVHPRSRLPSVWS